VVDLKITHFQVYRFSLPLAQPLTVHEETLTERKGLLVELGSDTGHVALGETSPLTGFSHENVQQAKKDIERLRKAVAGRQIPAGLETLSGGFDDWLADFRLAPSVRFGFETAVLGLVAAAKGASLSVLLGDKPSRFVMVNALLTGSRGAVMEKADRLVHHGYKAFKLKVGRQVLDKDVDIVRELKGLIGQDTILRLDANRSWDLAQALAFAAQLEGIPIDYLEEPVGSLDMLEQLLEAPAMSIPVALDESLVEMVPKDLSSWVKVKAVVLKPTLLGFEKTMQFARMALHVGLTPVISAAFESGVGLTVLAHIASSLQADHVPAGLDTLDWFSQDLLPSPFRIEKGRLAVGAVPATAAELKGHLIRVSGNE
jgi:O-succinylbenzoate synthase